MRLTDREYWEKEYKGKFLDEGAGNDQTSLYKRVTNLIKKLVGKKNMRMAAPYDQYLLFDIVLARCLGDVKKGLNVMEIGCAPGSLVIKLAKAFDLTPHGVEYTLSGAKLCKDNFERHGLDPDNIFYADVLSDEFQSQHSEKYEVVISRGLIEHFEHPDNIVKAHMLLLKPGGHLIISVPNLRGIYWLWTYIFNKSQLPLHNLHIMRLSEFRKLFSDGDLHEQWCGYIGTFNLWMFTADKPGSVLKFILRIRIVAQMALNVLFRLVFRDKGMETSLLSPDLLYIGKKCV